MKQKTVRVPNPALLDECSELLERQIGQSLPQATIVGAALVALRNQHVHELITKPDCRAWGLQAAICTTAEAIQLLMDCGYLESATYTVVPHETKGIQIRRNDVALRDPDKPASTRPDWAAVN